MLESVKIQKRQSEVRQQLADLMKKETPTEDEIRSIETLDKDYSTNEVRFRAALTLEENERREAKEELEKRDGAKGDEWSGLIEKFEMRQVAQYFSEGRQLDGATAEVVSELRSKGGYRGLPVPWEAMALEQRAGETIASGTPNPKMTAPIIDRIFADSAAIRMGARMISIDHGEQEYPVTNSQVTAGWAATETGAVAGPAVYSTIDRPLAPDHHLGITMKITRKALKQSGAALEAAVRRDMNGAISEALDAAVFLGSGNDGEPTGVIAGAGGFGIGETAIGAAASWAAFRQAVTDFIIANAANGPGDVRLLIRPEIFNAMDDDLIEGTAVSEWDRLLKNIPAQNIVMSSNALAAPAESPPASTAVLTTAKGGVPPIFVGVWGGVDLIRDPFSDAASGGLRLTGLVTMDVTISRAAQLEILTGIQ